MHNKNFPNGPAVKRELDVFRAQLRPASSRTKPSSGDVLGIPRNLHGLQYEHYGIYAGDGRVIHYTSADSSEPLDLRIMETSFRDFMKSSREFFILNFDQLKNPVKSDLISIEGLQDTLSEEYLEQLEALLEIKELLLKSQMIIYSPEETLKRARSRLGENSYSLLLNNCEHFAVWCKTGLSRSYQIEKLLYVLTPGVTEK
ncbi:MAG TPA: lecithin retinol acyltransferase family protein [Bacillota bacterium]|nr:lecithin retinol acyltransferase family protein [Bacillota bacterium]